MKTTLKGSLITILFLFNMNSFIYGQEKTDSGLQRNVYLLEGNEKKEIVIPVSEQSNFLSLGFLADIRKGVITIEIYDPSGEKRKNYSVGSQTNPEYVSNAIKVTEPFKNPMKGNWIIKISCKNAKGRFVLDTNIKLYSENQPSKIITGTITNESNIPLSGAAIVIKGMTIGTISDKSGNFSLKVPNNADFLLISFLGMKTQELKIGEQSSFNITLKH
jgi:hypothetical protein